MQRDQRVPTPVPADLITSTMTSQHQCLTSPLMRTRAGDRASSRMAAMIGSRARAFLLVALDGSSRSSSTTSAPSLGACSSMRRLLPGTASSEWRSGMLEERMTRQCAAADGLGASRDRRMRIDRPGYSIHSRHSMDQPGILSLSSTRRTVRCAAMPIRPPLDPSPRRISGPGRSDEEPSEAALMRRPMLDATPTDSSTR